MSATNRNKQIKKPLQQVKVVAANGRYNISGRHETNNEFDTAASLTKEKKYDKGMRPADGQLILIWYARRGLVA